VIAASVIQRGGYATNDSRAKHWREFAGSDASSLDFVFTRTGAASAAKFPESRASGRDARERQLLDRSFGILGCAVRHGAQAFDCFRGQVENHRSAQDGEIAPR
jgi:hypothetical protein